MLMAWLRAIRGGTWGGGGDRWHSCGGGGGCRALGCARRGGWLRRGALHRNRRPCHHTHTQPAINPRSTAASTWWPGQTC